jgi:O-methyltransferase involved in polyketide biosynthesis
MSEAETPGRPCVAGMYDYYLGGTANTTADRAAVERIRERLPEIIDAAWANRGFLQRAVRRIVVEYGIRQFVDLGAGFPTQRPTHEVVHDFAPDGRVVYTDIDPTAVARGRHLLAGVTSAAVVEADIRQPEVLFAHPDTRRLIDLAQPVGLLFVAVTQFVPDADDPWGIVRRYVEAVAPGSYLALSAPTSDYQVERKVERAAEVYAATSTPATARTRAEIERFFAGLEIVPPYEGAAPSVAFVGEWGAEDPTLADSDGSRWFYAAVARLP